MLTTHPKRLAMLTHPKRMCVKYTSSNILLIKNNNKTKKVCGVESNQRKLSKIHFTHTSNMKTFYHLLIKYDMLLKKKYTRPNLMSQA